MSEGFRVPRCVCGHLQGDHRSSGARFPHPLRYGVCLMPNCGCTAFVLDDEQARSEAWLTDIGEDAAA